MDTMTAIAAAPVSDHHRKLCADKIDRTAAWEGEPVSQVEWSEHEGVIHFRAMIGKGITCVGAPKSV